MILCQQVDGTNPKGKRTNEKMIIYRAKRKQVKPKWKPFNLLTSLLLCLHVGWNT